MRSAELLFLRGDERLLSFKIDRAELCIGRHATNDVVVPDATADVAAVLFDRGEQRYRLRDLTGGKLTINATPIESDEVDLSEGDVLGLGGYKLKLHCREAADSPRPSRTAVLETSRSDVGQATLTHDGRETNLRGAFNIGADEDNDLVIDDGFVSSFHCRIFQREGRWFVVDLSSTNGTLVNGLRVSEAELPAKATIQAGKVALTFSLGAAARPQAPATRLGMIAQSARMTRVFELIDRMAQAREPVLIIGESGTGKELVAAALHQESPRKPGLFLALNCGALSSGVIESELFGHNKGAFTGAVADKEGAFEATSGGTLFLDEIGELPLELQPKLLRVLESSKVRRVGGTKEISVDTRIVAATHRNLEELVDDGRFREDLFHRLFVLSIRLPALRERPEDILPLAHHFLNSARGRKSLAPSAENALREHTWPGNIRELRNVLVRALLMSDGDKIEARDLEFSKDAFTRGARDVRSSVRTIEEDDRSKMVRALEEAQGNRAEAARLLGVSKSTFHDRMRRYGINTGR